MKNKTIAILLLATTISISGCGGCSQNEASTEPTEVVMETETEEVAIETETVIETEEPTERIYHDALIVNEDGTYDFTDSFIGGLMSYDFFDGCNEEEVRDYVKSNDTFKILLIDGTPELIDGFINSVSMNGEITLKQLLGQNDTSNSNTSSNKGSNTNSNKGNSSSTSNNTGNTAGSQSNTNSSSAGSNSSTPADQGNTVETPPADSNEANMQGDGTFTFDDASNLGNEGHTDYNNTIQ